MNMKFNVPKHITSFCVLAALALHCSTLHAQVPQQINYQGRVVVGSSNFNGSGQFKFALFNNANGQTLWNNDGTTNVCSAPPPPCEPTYWIDLNVSNGLFSVPLGDTSIKNMPFSNSPQMPAIPTLTVFNNSDVRLRVWFNDGTHGWQLLSPDQRIASVGYAFVAASLGDSSTGAVAFPSGDQLKIQAPGGIKLQTGGSGTGVTLTTSTDSANTNGLNVDGDINSTSVVTAAAITVGPDLAEFTGFLSGTFAEFSGGVTAAGGDFSAQISGTSANFSGDVGVHALSGTSANFAGNVSAQSFSTTSDRNTKEGFRSVNAREVLSHLAGIPIQTWSFKQDDFCEQHIGPMAQDFYSAFQVGPDDKHITTVDADGVAFAAIQGLNEIVQEQNAELSAKGKKIEALEKRLDQIENTLKSKTATKNETK